MGEQRQRDGLHGFQPWCARPRQRGRLRASIQLIVSGRRHGHAARAEEPPGLPHCFLNAMEEQGKPILSATEARQATRGHGVRYVLAASVTLAVIAMLIAYFVA
jgi:hypothetical protein